MEKVPLKLEPTQPGPRGDPPERLTPRAPVLPGLYSPELLYQIIEVISSGPDLGTILHRFVPVVTAATDCHGCFIYLIEDSGFVLRSASAGYAHLEGKVRFGLDEGLAGWVARTKRSAFILSLIHI